MRPSVRRALGSLLVAVALFLPASASAQLQTFVREYTHRAGDAESKLTARAIAIEQVKKLLLEEIGTYLESHTESDKRTLMVNGRAVSMRDFFAQNIGSISAGITQTRVLEERWDGLEYWLKAEIKADPEETRRQLARIALEIGNAPVAVPAAPQPVPTAAGPSAPPGGGAAPAPALPPTQQVNRWEVGVTGCWKDGPFLDCDVSFTNQGRDRIMEVAACFPGDNRLLYCATASFQGAVQKPMGFLATTGSLPGDQPLGSRPSVTVLAGRTVRMTLRAENPPQDVIRHLIVRFGSDGITQRFGFSSDTVVFRNIRVGASPQGRTRPRDSAPIAAAASMAFEFSVRQCDRSGTNVTCLIEVFNHGIDRELQIRPMRQAGPTPEGYPRAIDAQDSIYSIRRVTFASAPAPNAGTIRQAIPSGDAVEMRIVIEGVLPAVESFTRIELPAQMWPDYPYGAHPSPVFTNVPIRRP